jgi:hypothetical protein
MSLHVSGATHPSSEGSAQMLFGVIACVGCVLTACRLQYQNLHAVNTRPTHAITLNSICAEPPEDGYRNLHAINTRPTHSITLNSVCAEPPEDWYRNLHAINTRPTHSITPERSEEWRVTPETCRGFDS